MYWGERGRLLDGRSGLGILAFQAIGWRFGEQEFESSRAYLETCTLSRSFSYFSTIPVNDQLQIVGSANKSSSPLTLIIFFNFSPLKPA